MDDHLQRIAREGHLAAHDRVGRIDGRDDARGGCQHAGSRQDTPVGAGRAHAHREPPEQEDAHQDRARIRDVDRGERLEDEGPGQERGAAGSSPLQVAVEGEEEIRRPVDAEGVQPVDLPEAVGGEGEDEPAEEGGQAIAGHVPDEQEGPDAP